MLQARLRKLEQRVAARDPLPHVVFKREGETLTAACERALDGKLPTPDWAFVLAPEPITAEEWQQKYSPSGDIPVIVNPTPQID